MRIVRVAAMFAVPAGLSLGALLLAGSFLAGLSGAARAQGLPPINLLADGPTTPL